MRQAKAAQAAALDSIILRALKETEQALSTYRATLDNRQALVDAQDYIHRSVEISKNESAAGSLSLSTQQSVRRHWRSPDLSSVMLIRSLHACHHFFDVSR
ncbi:MAG TPA: hypothetical protein VGL55_04025 [Steroidobacteraceae bacterium]